MRLGIAGLLPTSVANIDGAGIRRVREMGFAGAALYFFEPPQAIASERAAEIGRMFADEGVDVVEYGQYMTDLVHPDASVSRTNIETLRDACRVARSFGCPAVITGAGSLNPRSLWAPHPENRHPETIDRLITSLREVVPAAEREGVTVALECHVLTPLFNVATTCEVLDRVSSVALEVHLDPVNWMTLDTVYENGPAIAAMFAALGPERIYGAHSKGLVLEDDGVTHLNETYTGAAEDLIDHATVLREMAKLPDDPYLVIEHLPVEKMPGARDHLLGIASDLGLPVRDALARTV